MSSLREEYPLGGGEFGIRTNRQNLEGVGFLAWRGKKKPVRYM